MHSFRLAHYLIVICFVSVSVYAQKTMPSAQNTTTAVKTQQTAKPADTVRKISKPDSVVLAAPRFGRIRIVSTPDSAAIVVDSVERGETPLVVDSLSVGRHTALVKKKNYFVKKIAVDVVTDSLQEISVSLVRPGAIVVKSEPAGAKIVFDGKEVGYTPWENAKLKPGDYPLRLEYVQRDAVQRSVSVKEGACDTVMVDLPYAKSYTDSIIAGNQRLDAQKRSTAKIINWGVLGAFALFAGIIALIEATSVR